MIKNEARVKKIEFKSKYVSGQALDVITDFTNNTYIIKGSTGIGGTTALLNDQNGHRLIISPNVGMIQSKEVGKYQSQKQFFVYSDKSKPPTKIQWNEVKDSLTVSDNIIINTTPNQITRLRADNKELYNELVNIPIFIDEIHAFTTASDYRKEVGQFLELIYNEWNAIFKLSTATPNYNYLDVPTDKQTGYFKLIRAIESSKPIQLSSNSKDARQFIYDEYLKGHKVIVFSNNIKFHLSFNNLRVANLVGKNLGVKLAPYKQGGNPNGKDLFSDNDVIVCSSSFFAGYDIPIDCSICIISEQKNPAYKIHVNDLVQAYGRCRATVHNALFVNVTAKYDIEGNPTTYPTTQIEINKLLANYQTDLEYWQQKVDSTQWFDEIKHQGQITPQGYVNRAFILAPILQKVYDYQLYNKDVLKDSLKGYGFTLSKYINPDPHQKFKTKRPQFNERMKNILNLDETTLLKDYHHLKRNIKFKDFGNFSANLVFQYLTAYLLKKTDANVIIKKLSNKRVKANEFYKSVDSYLRTNVDTTYYTEQPTQRQQSKNNQLYGSPMVRETLKEIQHLTNDWQYLYGIHKVVNNILPDEIERYINFSLIVYDVDLYKKHQSNKAHRVRNVATQIIKRCEDNGIYLTNNEIKKTANALRFIFSDLDKGQTDDYLIKKTRETMKKQIINVLIFLMTNGKAGDYKEVKSREYNPLTQLSGSMRSIIPIKHLAIDLKSANPQIVDSILNTNQGLKVYDCLMTKRNIDRDNAKVLYNSTLNNHRLNTRQAKAVYLDCGYDNQNALKLAQMTSGVQKGAFYEVMTAKEKELMKNYAKILPIDSHRLHDAIIVSLQDVEEHNIKLPTDVLGFKYQIEYFNDSQSYTGQIDNIPFNGGMVENSYYLT